LRQAVALRDAVRDNTGDPRDVVTAFDRVTEETCAPWYHMQVARDRARYVAVQAAIEGREIPGPADNDPAAKMQTAFATAAAYDPDIARASLEVFGCLTLPHEVLARPGMLDKVMSVAAGREAPETAGPTRAELVALVSA
jgi:hypothetical protein